MGVNLFQYKTAIVFLNSTSKVKLGKNPGKKFVIQTAMLSASLFGPFRTKIPELFCLYRKKT